VTQEIQPAIQSDPTVQIVDPKSPAVISALYDFVYSSSEISGVVLESETPPALNDPTDNDSDSTPYGTNRGDVLDKLAEGRIVGSVAFVSLNGNVEIIPPLKDKEKEAQIVKAILETAEKARINSR